MRICEEALLLRVVRKMAYNPYNPYKAQKCVGVFLTKRLFFLQSKLSLRGGCPPAVLVITAYNKVRNFFPRVL